MLSTEYRAARNSCNAVGLGVTTLEILLPVKLSICSICDSAIQLIGINPKEMHTYVDSKIVTRIFLVHYS